MSDRVILMFGMEQTLGVPPSHCFWLYAIEQERMIERQFSDQQAAISWAKENGATIVDDWDRSDVVQVEDFVAEHTDKSAYVVCVTLYRNGRIVPNEGQPAHRYWIFRKDGRRIATRATLGEALGWTGALSIEKPTNNQTIALSGLS